MTNCCVTDETTVSPLFLSSWAKSKDLRDSSIPRSLPWAQSNGLHSEWQPTIWSLTWHYC